MNPNGHQSTSSCSGNYGYEPYMLGSSSFGVGVSQTVSASGFRRNGGRNSVRDCMQWDNISSEMSGNSARLSGNGGFWNTGNSSGMGNSTTTSMGFNYTQPKAFLRVPGGGEGQSSSGVSIPCQIAPLGTNPASMLKPMEPVTLRVTAPTPTTNSNGGTGPYVFTMDPAQLYGNNNLRR
ncbi:hypothetical protein Fcan01_07358 [Folsomia candida]|uniref:Uncharacterized protein n=1 Tax=Folsomia candida TaxID=158441 RepID=A0A226EHN7_FOLCA|nr:hypothetical protein Fcan01_07358 [Folsomia candida]